MALKELANTFKGARGSVFAATLALPLAFGGTAGLVANDAKAQDAKPTDISLQASVSPREAMEMSANQIVIFYDGDSKDIRLSMRSVVGALRDEGFPVVAVSGSPKKDVAMLLVGGKFRGKFTENDISGGVLNLAAETAFNKILASLNNEDRTASLN